MTFPQKGTTLPRKDRSIIYKLIGSNKKLLVHNCMNVLFLAFPEWN